MSVILWLHKSVCMFVSLSGGACLYCLYGVRLSYPFVFIAFFLGCARAFYWFFAFAAAKLLPICKKRIW